MKTVNNIREHLCDEQYQGKYMVTYGNEYHGYAYTKEELIKKYRNVLRQAFRQDVSIFLDGKIIRSIYNFNQKITNKSVRYTCQVVKY